MWLIRHRQEASGIPHLLVAPKSGPQLPQPPRRPHRTTTTTTTQEDLNDDDEPIDRSIYTDGQGDARGYYQDGAYTAAPDPQTTTTHSSQDGDEALKIAEAYFASLRYQFSRLRTQLHTPPPSHLVLPKTHAPYVGPFGPSSRTFTIWTTRLLTTDPHPIQLALMDKNSAFRLLRVLLGGGKFLRSGVEVTERTSRWVWSLLARLPDRGELDHVETGHIRELGKRAAVLMHSLKQMALLREEVELAGHGEEEAVGVWGGEDDDDEEEEQEQGKDVETEVKPKEEDDNPPAETTTRTIRHDNDEPSADTFTARNSKPEDTNTETRAKLNAGQDEMEDGEIDDSSDQSVPMDMDDEEDMEAAKARLLASLDAVPSSPSSSSPSSPSKQEEVEQEEEKFDPVRARMNMRATLNMILTVAGEFYGQRDLLEFRDPFRWV